MKSPLLLIDRAVSVLLMALKKFIKKKGWKNHINAQLLLALVLLLGHYASFAQM